MLLALGIIWLLGLNGLGSVLGFGSVISSSANKNRIHYYWNTFLFLDPHPRMFI
ncbi:hypothetical protein I3843_07G039600 [Carya illinoinensis]|nr:hypothetical protein I3843_07G039600 [Carya illinoinensis]